MKKILISFFFFLLQIKSLYAQDYFLTLKSTTDIKKAINQLVATGDFGYFVALASERGVVIGQITSNITEKQYTYYSESVLYNEEDPNNPINDGYWGNYLFSKNQLKKIVGYQKKYKNRHYYGLAPVEYQAISTFDKHLKTTYRSSIFGKYEVEKIKLIQKIFKDEKDNYLIVNYKEAAGFDTFCFYFMLENGIYKLRYYMP